MTKLNWELLLFNLFITSIFAVGLFFNLTQKLFAYDETYMTYVNATILFVAVGYSFYKSFFPDSLQEMLLFLGFLSVKVYLYIGLMGTIIGLYLFLASGNTALTAMAPVFFSTFVGLAARTWTESILYIFRRNALVERL